MFFRGLSVFAYLGARAGPEFPGGAGHLAAAHRPVMTHAQNKRVGRMIVFSVLRSWDKNTMICVGVMSCRRDFPVTTRILSFQTKYGMCVWRGGGGYTYSPILSVALHSPLRSCFLFFLARLLRHPAQF